MPNDRSPSKPDLVIAGVVEMVATGELQPDARLPVEHDLATRLGVSRASLREGMRALVALGVVETRWGVGNFVTTPDTDALLNPLAFFADLQQLAHADDLMSVRQVLELESVSLATARITDGGMAELDAVLSEVVGIEGGETPDPEVLADADIRFHGLLAHASGNSALPTMIEALMGRTAQVELWRAISSAGGLRDAHAEHTAILDAVRRRHVERARTRMAVHLLGVEQYSRAGRPEAA